MAVHRVNRLVSWTPAAVRGRSETKRVWLSWGEQLQVEARLRRLQRLGVIGGFHIGPDGPDPLPFEGLMELLDGRDLGPRSATPVDARASGETMAYEVEMHAFAGGAIRKVEVPKAQVAAAGSEEAVLERIFYWGQNDFQPRELPSVSIGDVIRLSGRRWKVAPMGFAEVQR